MSDNPKLETLDGNKGVVLPKNNTSSTNTVELNKLLLARLDKFENTPKQLNVTQDYGITKVGSEVEKFDYIKKFTGEKTFLNTPADVINNNYITAQTNEARKLAEEQGVLSEFGGFLAQSVIGEIVLGTVEGVGYLLDVQHWGSKLMGEEGDWDNWLSNWAADSKEGIREWAPIHLNPDSQNKGIGTSMGDSAWWFSNGVSVASAASMLIPVMGAARGIGIAGKGLAAIGQAGRVGKLGGRTAKVVSKVDKVTDFVGPMGENTKLIATGARNGTMSRLIESQMEATGVFREKLEQYSSIPGMTDEQAKKAAGDAASFTYKANWAMLLTDIPQYVLLGTAGRKLKGALHTKKPGFIQNNKLLKNTKNIRSIATTMGSEGIEEAYQFVASEEGKRHGDIIAGIPGAGKDGNFGDRWDKYYEDAELWTSAMFGALGGGVFKAAGPGVSNLMNKAFRKGEERITAEDVRLSEEKDRHTKINSNLELLKQATAAGDPEMIFAAKSNMAFDTARDATMANNYEQARVSMAKMKNATPEERAEYGITEDFEEFVGGIDAWIGRMDVAANIVEKAKFKYTAGLADIVARRQFQKVMHGEQATDLDRRMEETAAEVFEDREMLSPDGNSAIDFELKLQGAKRANKVLLDQANKEGITDSERTNLLEEHLAGEQFIKQLEENLDLINKESETLTDLDKEAIATIK